jgi:hypothetical protein
VADTAEDADELGNNIAIYLGLSARILAKQGERGRVAHLSGAAHNLLEKQGRLSSEDSALDSILPGWQAGADGEAIRQAFADGRGLTVDEAVEFAFYIVAF